LIRRVASGDRQTRKRRSSIKDHVVIGENVALHDPKPRQAALGTTNNVLLLLRSNTSRGLCHGNERRIERARTDQVSRHCNGVFPLARRFGSENPERRSRDEMALKVEVIVDGGMHAQKALGGSS